MDFYCDFHVGDNLMNLRFFFYLSPILKERGIKINYYYDTSYKYNTLHNLIQYVDPEVVTLKDWGERPSTSIRLWMGDSINDLNYYDHIELYHEQFYLKILNHLGITGNNSMWIDEPYLLNTYDQLEDKYKNIDILIINSPGRSGQYNDTTELNNICIELNKKYNIVTTEKINDEIKTAEHLLLREVGAISTHATYVIAVCTGPFCCCFNYYSKHYVKKWFVLSDFKFYSIPYSVGLPPIKDFFKV